MYEFHSRHPSKIQADLIATIMMADNPNYTARTVQRGRSWIVELRKMVNE